MHPLMQRCKQMLQDGDAKAKINQHSLRINTNSVSTPLYICSQYRFYDIKAYLSLHLATVLALHLSALMKLSEEKQMSAAIIHTRYVSEICLYYGSPVAQIMDNGIGSK